MATMKLPYSQLFWWALNLANSSKNVIGEFKLGECVFRVQVLLMTSLIVDTPVINKSTRYSERVSQGVNKTQLQVQWKRFR